MKEIERMYMVATKAYHKLGDLSREMEPGLEHLENLCSVTKEDDENYYGMWVTGMGFFDVKFPKETTRQLTEEEIEHCDGKYIAINSQPGVKLKVK